MKNLLPLNDIKFPFFSSFQFQLFTHLSSSHFRFFFVPIRLQWNSKAAEKWNRRNPAMLVSILRWEEEFLSIMYSNWAWNIFAVGSFACLNFLNFSHSTRQDSSLCTYFSFNNTHRLKSLHVPTLSTFSPLRSHSASATPQTSSTVNSNFTHEHLCWSL